MELAVNFRPSSSYKRLSIIHEQLLREPRRMSKEERYRAIFDNDALGYLTLGRQDMAVQMPSIPLTCANSSTVKPTYSMQISSINSKSEKDSLKSVYEEFIRAEDLDKPVKEAKSAEEKYICNRNTNQCAGSSFSHKFSYTSGEFQTRPKIDFRNSNNMRHDTEDKLLGNVSVSKSSNSQQLSLETKKRVCACSQRFPDLFSEPSSRRASRDEKVQKLVEKTRARINLINLGRD